MVTSSFRWVKVILTGFDEQDQPVNKGRNGDKFVILHAGQLGYDRLPDQLFKALGKAVEKDPFFAEKLELRLAGQVDYTVKEAIKASNLTENVHFLGFLSRKEVIKNLGEADILLLLLNKAYNAKGRIPGKLFEYLGSAKPILALGEPDSDVGSILQETEVGTCIAYENGQKIYDFIQKYWHEKGQKMPLFLPF